MISMLLQLVEDNCRHMIRTSTGEQLQVQEIALEFLLELEERTFWAIYRFLDIDTLYIYYACMPNASRSMDSLIESKIRLGTSYLIHWCKKELEKDRISSRTGYKVPPEIPADDAFACMIRVDRLSPVVGID